MGFGPVYRYIYINSQEKYVKKMCEWVVIYCNNLMLTLTFWKISKAIEMILVVTGEKNIFNDDVTNWSHWIFLTRKLAENDTSKVCEYSAVHVGCTGVQRVLYRCTGVQDGGVCSCEALKTTRTSQLVRDTRHHRVTASSWRLVFWWGCVK